MIEEHLNKIFILDWYEEKPVAILLPKQQCPVTFLFRIAGAC